jgi:hypothetical protein
VVGRAEEEDEGRLKMTIRPGADRPSVRADIVKGEAIKRSAAITMGVVSSAATNRTESRSRIIREDGLAATASVPNRPVGMDGAACLASN